MSLKHKNIKKSDIYFSKWSRKNYAVFAGLHKLIKICQLSVSFFSIADLKSENKYFSIKKLAQIREEKLTIDEFLEQIMESIFEEKQVLKQCITHKIFCFLIIYLCCFFLFIFSFPYLIFINIFIQINLIILLLSNSNILKFSK